MIKGGKKMHTLFIPRFLSSSQELSSYASEYLEYYIGLLGMLFLPQGLQVNIPSPSCSIKKNYFSKKNASL